MLTRCGNRPPVTALSSGLSKSPSLGGPMEWIPEPVRNGANDVHINIKNEYLCSVLKQ